MSESDAKQAAADARAGRGAARPAAARSSSTSTRADAPAWSTSAPRPRRARRAVARGARAPWHRRPLRRFRTGGSPKGDALAVARLAGNPRGEEDVRDRAARHPLALDVGRGGLRARRARSARSSSRRRPRTTGKTGVEMEALTAVAGACLALYDMAKALDRGDRDPRDRAAREDGRALGPLPEVGGARSIMQA